MYLFVVYVCIKANYVTALLVDSTLLEWTLVCSTRTR